MLGGISIWQLSILLVIVVLVFGTKKLTGLGSDLGGAIKGFKKAMNDEESKPEELEKKDADFDTAQAKVESKESDKTGS